jgi:hypothetical protein
MAFRELALLYLHMFISDYTEVSIMTTAGEIWYVTSREDHKLQVCQNEVLRNYLDIKTLNNGDLCDLYRRYSVVMIVKSRKLQWAGHVAGETGNVTNILVRKPLGKYPPRRLRRR